ncbi:MAG TPA: hypothetical protein VN845_07605 [Solirubrobacteraceae bacterium]|nr:hypothetical protein [Solirubrobacteraceae bacterium]
MAQPRGPRHTLCELGAEPLDRELVAVRAFLENHPDQVLIVIVEAYVPPETVERAFEETGLTRYVAKLDRDHGADKRAADRFVTKAKAAAAAA